MSHPPLLSVQVPTLAQRADNLSFLLGKLERQVRAAGLQDQVEILVLCDDGETPTGTKRNRLMDRAQGEYLVSIDDDDDVHERYLSLIVDLLRQNPGVDCIGIKGEVSFAGAASRTFIYSTRYKQYRTRNGIYQRPPHHLNPIRRQIARRYAFEPVWTSEDSDCALRMARDGALRTEVFLDEVIYYYRSQRKAWVQSALDHTEFIRHPLGLQWVNRLRVRRWWRSLLSAGAEAKQ